MFTNSTDYVINRNIYLSTICAINLYKISKKFKVKNLNHILSTNSKTKIKFKF